jgi:hypothetical protein
MPSFLYSNGSFFPNGYPVVLAPLTGTTIVLPKGTEDVYLNPAGTLAALTIKLPPNPLPGVVVSIASSQTITALTVQTFGGAAVAGAPTTLAINTNVYFNWIRGAWVVTTNVPSAPVVFGMSPTPPSPADPPSGPVPPTDPIAIPHQGV